jgi:hypothetical protein
VLAADYLREVFAAFDHGYAGDCVTHACRLTELLLAEGKKPWIARLRDVRHTPSGVFHGPLTPIRLAGRKGPTWTTHYVACDGDDVYDPLNGAPVVIANYSFTAFGRDIPIEQLLNEAATAELCASNELRAAMR